MTKEEFINQTERLCGLYNKTLNDYQLDFWYESLKKYELKDYRQGVGEFVKKNKYMPTISELLAEIQRIRDLEATNIPTEIIEKVECQTCHRKRTC